MNFLYICLSAKITNKFESNNIKFHKSLYAETGTLEGLNLWVYKTGPQSYTLFDPSQATCLALGRMFDFNW